MLFVCRLYNSTEMLYLALTDLFEGKGGCLSAADLFDRHPLAVDGFDSDGYEDAKRVWP